MMPSFQRLVLLLILELKLTKTTKVNTISKNLSILKIVMMSPCDKKAELLSPTFEIHNDLVGTPL
jgi:hypothetical protein